MAQRAAARAAARGGGAADVTAEDVRECEKALREEWAAQPPW